MKLNKLFIVFASTTLMCVCACESSDRITGNEEAAHANAGSGTDTNSTNTVNPDTTVTGVPGNTNAVNAAGNAGNGSGMGSSSNTEAEKKH